LDILKEMKEMLGEDEQYNKYKDADFISTLKDDMESYGVDSEDRLEEYEDHLMDLQADIPKRLKYIKEHWDELIEEFS